MPESRRMTHAIIGTALVLLPFCGLPPACDAQSAARKPLVGALSALGLCQPEWRLFAPNVHKTNSYLSADVTMADGSIRHWESPEFGERTWTTRFVQGQLPKLYDNLRLDRNRAAWRPFSEWVAREVGQGNAVHAVRLVRHYYEIPPPDAPDGRDGVPARDRSRSHVFYERRR